MIEHAELALLAARRLEPRKYGWLLVADVRARVRGELANAYRVADDLTSAEEALLNAVAWAKRGSGDLFLAARPETFSASLWPDLRRFPLALAALEKVICIYRNLKETHCGGPSAHHERASSGATTTSPSGPSWILRMVWR